MGGVEAVISALRAHFSTVSVVSRFVLTISDIIVRLAEPAPPYSPRARPPRVLYARAISTRCVPDNIASVSRCKGLEFIVKVYASRGGDHTIVRSQALVEHCADVDTAKYACRASFALCSDAGTC